MPNINVDLLGIDTNLVSYSFSVNVPSLDPVNTEASSGSISFATGPLNRPQQYRNKRFTISDSNFGSLIGRVSEVSGGYGSVNFTAETVFQRLTATSYISPNFGVSTLTAMNAVLALGGFSCTGLSNVGTDTFPGWKGSILAYLQMFCVARNLEYVIDGEILEFRAVRGTTYTGNIKDASFTLNDQSLAQNVDVVQYGYTTGADIELFPVASQDDPQILTVEADGQIDYDIKINGWADTLNQPTQTLTVGPAVQDGTTGTYCVSGTDGLPVTVAQWTDRGGFVQVIKTDDPSIIRVSIHGPSSAGFTDGIDPLSPYSIAASSGDGTYYNGLHITGRGIRYIPTTHRLPTGATSDTTIEETGGTIENPFLNSLSLVYDVGVRAAQTYAGPTYAISANTLTAATYDDILGAKLPLWDSVFRLTAANVGPSGVSYSGESDTTMADFDTAWTGETFADFNAVWTGKTFGDFSSLPLAKTFS